MSREHGQASIEYVAVVALVGVVLTTAVALTTGGLGDRIVWALRTAMCRVTGSGCPGPPRDRADLPPCPVRDDSSEWGAALEVAVFRLGRDVSVRKVRLSNGHVEVSFGEGHAGGVHVGLGARLAVPHVDVDTHLSTGVDWNVTAGQTWRFASEAAADRFIKRYGSRLKPLNSALDSVRRLCFVCHQPEPLPPADVTTYAHGTGVKVEVLSEHGLLGGLSADLNRQLLGSTRNADGSRALFLSTTDGVRSNLLTGLGASFDVAHTGSVELDLDARGAPTAVSLHGVWSGRALGRGRVRESDVVLSRPSRADVRGLRLLLSRRLVDEGSLGDLTTLLGDLRRGGVTTRRTYAATGGSGEVAAGVEAGVSLGLGISSTHSRLRLVDETTQLPGMRALPRGDCAAGAA